jgi:hypothetical protein
MTDTNLNEALETVKSALKQAARAFEMDPFYFTADLDNTDEHWELGRSALAALAQIEARLGELEKEQRVLRDWYDESPMKEWPDD